MGDSSTDVMVRSEALRQLLTDLFQELGMTLDNATWCAECLVLTNLWGIDSHGVLRLPIYIQRLARGVIKANPDTRVTSSGGAFEVLDGDDGMGFVAARAAMTRAIALAQQHRIGAVAVTRSNHFGAAALYAHQAAEAGMASLVMTNVLPNLVAPGSSQPISGNNPIAFGAPTPVGFPFLLDISMSAVSGGKLLLARAKGEKIPLDWATDSNGFPTDDPQVGFDGFLQPMAGHKGFGLSLMVDILCGVISGGTFQFAIKSMYTDPDAPSKTGHFMVAIDPTIASGRDEYLARMGAFYRTIKASPTITEASEMFLPGEIEERRRRERAKNGIPLTRALFAEINEIAEARGVRPLPEVG